jgi:hypothetical protein
MITVIVYERVERAKPGLDRISPSFAKFVLVPALLVRKHAFLENGAKGYRHKFRKDGEIRASPPFAHCTVVGTSSRSLGRRRGRGLGKDSALISADFQLGARY